ncbi:MAG: PDZ domain-containing protein, partial [Saprospiraceae bacterium]|nr:PDZ domain-containing protein [Saprospiraceae bacterium]
MKQLILILCSVAFMWPGQGTGQTQFRDLSIAPAAATAFLGVQSNTVSREKAKKLGFDNPYGSYVTSVIGNTAAERAGIQPFDYIYRVDERETTQYHRLGDILADYEPGNKARIFYQRNGIKRSADVVLGTREEAVYQKVGQSEKAFLGISPVYEAGASADGIGVNIVESSTAEAIGLQDGDRITAINGFPMIDWDDITTAIGMLRAGAQVNVTYLRNGKSAMASGAIKSLTTQRPREEIVEKNVESYRDSKDYAFLGIYSEGLDKEKAEKLGYDNPYGSYVTSVIRSSAAAKADIRPFDYVYGVDEYRVGENQQLTGILKKYAPGDKATILLIRQGQKKEIPVVLGSRSDAEEKPSRNKCEDPFLGITEHKSSGENDRGIAIGIVDNSTAKEIGLQNGDRLLSINGHRMVDWNDIGMAIDNLRVGETIQVAYLRNGKESKASGPIKSYSATKNCRDCDCDELDQTFQFEIDPDFELELHHGAAPALADLTAQISEVGADDAQQMRNKYDLDLPQSSNLKLNAIRIASNQLEGSFRLEFELPQAGETSVRIYSGSGRLIYDYDLGSFSGRFSDDVNLAQNGPGKYFLLVRQGNQRLARK